LILGSILFIYFIITGQTVILIVPRGRGRLQGKNYKGDLQCNACTINLLQSVIYLQMCFINKFLSVISITGIDNEFHSMIFLGKQLFLYAIGIALG